jgi:hypothetical protein
MRTTAPSEEAAQGTGSLSSNPNRPAARHPRIQTAQRCLLAGLFVAALWLPMADMVLGLAPQHALMEKRPLATWPAFTLRLDRIGHMLRQVPPCLRDRFGFRSMLIHWCNVVKIRWMGVSSSPDVILGKNGWLFYAGDNSVDDYRCAKPFTPAELERWRQLLERREEWLRRRGIRYLIVFPPNSYTIYPEYAPDWMTRLHPESRLDQLVGYLRANSRLEVLDVRPALMEAKRQGRLFLQTDTHWNDLGVFIAYGQIMERLHAWFPELAARSIAEFNVSFASLSHGDLATLLDAQDRYREEYPLFVSRRPARAKRQVLQAAGTVRNPYLESVAVSTVDDPGLPRAVMVHDSFGIGLMPFLSEHFQRLLYVHRTEKHYFPAQIIAQEKPDVVIEEEVERTLMAMPDESLDAPILPPPPLPLETELNFHKGQPGAAFLRSGFWHPGSGVVWSEDESSEIAFGRIEAAEPGQAYQLVLRLIPFAPSPENPRRFSMSLNGRPAVAFAMTSPRETRIEFNFDSRDLRDENVLLFQIESPRSPKELGMSDDARRLGIGIVSMTLHRLRSPP